MESYKLLYFSPTDGPVVYTVTPEVMAIVRGGKLPEVVTPPVVVTPDPPKVDPPVIVTPPVASALKLETPDYSATTGLITFKSSGGDSSPVEFSAPGITGWTTKATHSVGEMQKDPKSVTITARQSGKQTAPLIFDLKTGGSSVPIDTGPVMLPPSTKPDSTNSRPPVITPDTPVPIDPSDLSDEDPLDYYTTNNNTATN